MPIKIHKKQTVSVNFRGNELGFLENQRSCSLEEASNPTGPERETETERPLKKHRKKKTKKKINY